MKDPVAYAKSLVDVHGSKKARELARSCRRCAQDALANGGVPYAEEVDLQEHTTTATETGKQVTRIITIVDEPAKAARLAKGLKFWDNVVGYLRNKYPTSEEIAAKVKISSVTGAESTIV